MKGVNPGKILIIIPAYNEGENIVRVTDEIRTGYPQYDYVVVNDGSTDDTVKICKEHEIRHINLPVNLGLSGAIRTGISYALKYGYDYAVQLDGDGQHCPRYIENMYRVMKEKKADIVIGSRFKTEKKPFNIRMMGSRLISAAIWITTKGTHIHDGTSGMRMFNRRMMEEFAERLNYHPEPDTLAFLINHGVKIEEVQVTMRERVAGKSYLNVVRSVRYMVHVLFNILVFQWVRKE